MRRIQWVLRFRSTRRWPVGWCLSFFLFAGAWSDMVTYIARGFLALSLAFSWSAVAPAADPAPAVESAPAAPAAEFNPLAVPQTTELKPLLAYIEQVSEWQPMLTPEMRSDKDAMTKVKDHMAASRVAMISAIDKALALQPTEVERSLLLNAKLNGLRMISGLTSDEKLEKQAEQDFESLMLSLVKDKNPKMARYASMNMLMIRMKRYAEGRGNESLDALVAEVTTMINSNESRSDGISLASNLTSLLEMKGQYDAAKKLYNVIITSAAKLEDPQMQKQAASSAEEGLARLGLLGKEPNLKGVQTDGQPFDIAALKGKVVLIDFWATWCAPCRAELPNVLKNYEQYHKAGFEVVGISLDEDRTALDGFLKQESLPWITLFNPDEATRGFEDPLVSRFFVNGIPATYLVDPAGKLVQIGVRGERLGELLKTYYPEVK